VEPPRARVEPLGVLPDEHHVDLRGIDGRERQRHARVRPGGAEVHVLVESEPDPQQQVALQHAGGDAGVAHRAEVQGVQPPELLQHGVGERLAGPQPPLAAEVVLDRVQGEPPGRGDRVEDLAALAHDLRAGSVARDHADAVAGGHVLAPSNGPRV
jgi:hypothetical protein